MKVTENIKRRGIGDYLRSLWRFLNGGRPVPGTLESVFSLLSSRQELSPSEWSADVTAQVGVSGEIADFMFQFFSSMGIPFGRVRPTDRLGEDLRLTEALQDDWDCELQDAFSLRFRSALVFPRKAPLATVADLLNVMQSALTGIGRPR